MLRCPVNRKMKKNKIAMLALCGILACGGAAGGAYALYSGSLQATENQFTIKAGKLRETDAAKVGTITEDKWNPENATDLMPNQEIEKNPKFISNAEYEAWCVMKVAIPTEVMKVGGEDTADLYDLVELCGVDTENWTLLEADKSMEDGTDSLYYYGYNHPLSKGEETSELFTSIKVPNISELTATVTDTVNVSAYIVQTEGYTDVEEAFVALGI